MNDSLINTIQGLFDSNMDNLKLCVEKCPDELWDKRVGGDFYWEHLYHAALTPLIVLPVSGKVIDLPVNSKTILDEGMSSKEHGKDFILSTLELTRKHIKDHLNQDRFRDLYETVDFLGKKMPRLAVVLVTMEHLMYHQGICDGALADFLDKNNANNNTAQTGKAKESSPAETKPANEQINSDNKIQTKDLSTKKTNNK